MSRRLVMAGVWTEARRKKHSRRIRQLGKQGLYKKAMNRPEVKKANGERTRKRLLDPKFRARHKKACQKAMKRPEVLRRLRAGIAVRDSSPIVKAAKDPERRRRVSEGQKKNWDTNPKRKDDTSKFKKAWWKSLSEDDEQRLVEKIMAANGVSPNKSETRLVRIFKKLKFDYMFVGNGKHMIAKHCPDFISFSRKEILEFNGIFWHKDRDKDIRRLEDYVAKGYRCLAIYYEVVDRRSIKKILKAIQLFRSRYSPICMATCS